MAALHERYRTALVTGASSGLGAAFARLLLSEGVAVWGTARSAARLAELRAFPAFHPVEMDLADPDAVGRSFASAQAASGGFDVLVNNAGFGLFAPFADETFEAWAGQLRVMLEQPMRLTHLVLPHLRARGQGALVNVTSLAVDFPLPYLSGYNAVKAGLAAFSESLLVETAGTEISVIDFRPGDYRTGFNRAMAPVPSTLTRSASSGRDLTRIWRTLEENLASAPPVERAATDLRRLLARGYRGTYRSGSFFQARLAPALTHWLPASLRRAVQWRYFHVE